MAKSEIERLAQLELIAHENKRDIAKLKEEASAFYRITVNQEMLTNTLNNLVADNKEQMKDFGQTLNRVNENLTNLNHSQETLKVAIEQVNSRVDTAVGQINNRVDELEDELEEEKSKDNISISEQAKKWAGWILFTLPTAIIGALIMYYLKLG